MFGLTAQTKVYVQLAPIDFRKSINGLSALVEQALQLSCLQDACFVFRNRRCDKVKILRWERNGFWLFYKRLEADRFVWPKQDAVVVPLTWQQLQWLLSGIDLRAMHGHPERYYAQAS